MADIIYMQYAISHVNSVEFYVILYHLVNFMLLWTRFYNTYGCVFVVGPCNVVVTQICVNLVTTSGWHAVDWYRLFNLPLPPFEWQC